MNSQIPGVIRALYNAASTTGAVVIVGPGATDDPGDNGLIQIGVDDPDETTYAHAATGSQAWAQLGGKFRDETFSIHCAAVAWNGGSDQTSQLAAMDSAFALLGSVESAIVADPTLTGAMLFSKGISAVGLKFASDSSGVTAMVLFDVECRTRI